jgi:hypothetical protein
MIAATPQIAKTMPAASAISPATIAPIAKPRSCHRRSTRSGSPAWVKISSKADLGTVVLPDDT